MYEGKALIPSAAGSGLKAVSWVFVGGATAVIN